jgi:hypothetical protein
MRQGDARVAASKGGDGTPVPAPTSNLPKRSPLAGRTARPHREDRRVRRGPVVLLMQSAGGYARRQVLLGLHRNDGDGPMSSVQGAEPLEGLGMSGLLHGGASGDPTGRACGHVSNFGGAFVRTQPCGCGRTIPRPVKALWPATVFCPCGARHNFPRRETPAKVRERAREAMRRLNEKRARLTPGCPTPTGTRPGPGTGSTETPSAKSHGSNHRGVGVPGAEGEGHA